MYFCVLLTSLMQTDKSYTWYVLSVSSRENIGSVANGVDRSTILSLRGRQLCTFTNKSRSYYSELVPVKDFSPFDIDEFQNGLINITGFQLLNRQERHYWGFKKQYDNFTKPQEQKGQVELDVSIVLVTQHVPLYTPPTDSDERGVRARRRLGSHQGVGDGVGLKRFAFPSKLSSRTAVQSRLSRYLLPPERRHGESRETFYHLWARQKNSQGAQKRTQYIPAVYSIVNLHL